MQKTILTLLALLLTLPIVARGAELSLGEKDTIFIDTIRIQPSLVDKAKNDGHSVALQRAAETLEAEFVNALSATRVFQIVERQELATLTHEQELAEKGTVDPESRNAALSGRLHGAKFVLIPTLTAFEERTTTRYYAARDRSDVTRTLFLGATVRIVNSKSGALLSEAPSVQLKRSESEENLLVDSVGGSEAFLVGQSKELAQKLAQEAMAMLRPAKILTVSGKQILINRGSEAGFRRGDLLEIFAVENIRDEESGETYRNEHPVGQAEIIRIDKKQSFAMINGDDLGIVAGAVVKLFQPPASLEGEKTETPSPPLSETPGSSEKPMKW